MFVYCCCLFFSKLNKSRNTGGTRGYRVVPPTYQADDIPINGIMDSCLLYNYIIIIISVTDDDQSYDDDDRPLVP